MFQGWRETLARFLGGFDYLRLHYALQVLMVACESSKLRESVRIGCSALETVAKRFSLSLLRRRHWFDSNRSHKCACRSMDRIPDYGSGDRGSTPLGRTNAPQALLAMLSPCKPESGVRFLGGAHIVR
jgi:hypothetical protein